MSGDMLRSKYGIAQTEVGLTPAQLKEARRRQHDLHFYCAHRLEQTRRVRVLLWLGIALPEIEQATGATRTLIRRWQWGKRDATPQQLEALKILERLAWEKYWAAHP
jgi:hypothetical protein